MTKPHPILSAPIDARRAAAKEITTPPETLHALKGDTNWGIAMDARVTLMRLEHGNFAQD